MIFKDMLGIDTLYYSVKCDSGFPIKRFPKEKKRLHGDDEILLQFNGKDKKVFLPEFNIKLHRVDICYDTSSSKIINQINEIFSNLSGKVTSYQQDGNFTGMSWYATDTRGISIRFYNKSLESNIDGDLWRFEIQVTSRKLSQYNRFIPLDLPYIMGFILNIVEEFVPPTIMKNLNFGLGVEIEKNDKSLKIDFGLNKGILRKELPGFRRLEEYLLFNFNYPDWWSININGLDTGNRKIDIIKNTGTGIIFRPVSAADRLKLLDLIHINNYEHINETDILIYRG